MSRRIDLATVIALTLLAFFVRISFSYAGLSWDDSHHILVARASSWSHFLHESSMARHPPLFFLFLKPFVAVATEPWMIRLPCQILGALLIPFCYLLGRQWHFDRLTLIVWTLLLAVHPTLVEASYELRSYTLALFPTLLATYVAWRFYENRDEGCQSRRASAALGATIFVSALCDYTAIPYLAALLLIAFWPIRWERSDIINSFQSSLPAAMGIAGAGIAIIYVIGETATLPGHAVAGTLPGTNASVWSYLWRQSSAYVSSAHGFSTSSWWLIGLLGILGLAAWLDLSLRRSFWFRLTLTIFLVRAVLGIGGWFPLSGGRYAMIHFPAILLLSVLALGSVSKRFSTHRPRVFLAAIAGLWIAVSFLQNQPATRDVPPPDRIAKLTRELLSPDTQLYAGPGGAIGAHWWLLRDQKFSFVDRQKVFGEKSMRKYWDFETCPTPRCIILVAQEFPGQRRRFARLKTRLRHLDIPFTIEPIPEIRLALVRVGSLTNPRKPGPR